MGETGVKCSPGLWEVFDFSFFADRLHLKLSSTHGSAWLAENWKEERRKKKKLKGLNSYDFKMQLQGF